MDPGLPWGDKTEKQPNSPTSPEDIDPMNIASPNIDELVQRLARLTGEDAETALKRAVEERLSRFAAAEPQGRRAALQKFFDRVSTMPVTDPRPVDEIIGYGPEGLPS